jgi:hypothetical protein
MGKTLPSHLLRAALLARMIFDPEDGGDTFLQNIGSNTDYTRALHWSRFSLVNVHFHTRLGLPSDLFLPHFPTIILHALIFSPFVLHALSI